MSRGKPIVSIEAVTALFLVSLIVWLSISLRSVRAEFVVQRSELRETRDSARVWRMESRIAHGLLTTLRTPADIPAVDVATGRHTTIDLVQGKILYIVSPSCAACADNFQTIIDLAERQPSMVLVLTTATQDEASIAYKELIGLMPVYSVDGRYLHEVVPGSVTPVTAAIKDQHRLRLQYGLLPPSASSMLESLIN